MTKELFIVTCIWFEIYTCAFYWHIYVLDSGNILLNIFRNWHLIVFVVSKTNKMQKHYLKSTKYATIWLFLLIWAWLLIYVGTNTVIFKNLGGKFHSRDLHSCRYHIQWISACLKFIFWIKRILLDRLLFSILLSIAVRTYINKQYS